MASAASAATARKQWEAENNVKTTTDDYYNVNAQQAKALQKAAPWTQDLKYFKHVHMSALALIKIIMHAKTGQGKAGVISNDRNNWVEVMGMLQGTFNEGAFIITDSFALPVEANEVECSLGEAAQLHLVSHTVASEQLGKADARTVGWYHSHPGYSCYLSGTDVPTQQNNQLHQDPFIALVVDPVRTISTGKAEIKAFRTYPIGHTPSDAHEWDGEGVPQSKIEEFGAHFAKYYEVPITIFRSNADARELDLLWNKYWMQTLSASPLTTNRRFVDERLQQLLSRVEKAERDAARGGGGVIAQRSRPGRAGTAGKAEKTKDPLDQMTRSVTSTTNEVLQGLLGMVVKQQVFTPSSAPAS